MSQSKNERTYLGDGVYAYFDGFHVVLVTNDGVDDINAIYLDPTVLADFDRFRESLMPHEEEPE